MGRAQTVKEAFVRRALCALYIFQDTI